MSECIEGSKSFGNRLNKKLSCTDGIPSVTNKLTIKVKEEIEKKVNGKIKKIEIIVDYDVYVHVGFFEDRIAYIEMYLCGMHDKNIRTLVEQVCSDARLLLVNEVCEVDYVIGGWRGREFAPEGYCPQLAELDRKNIAAPKSILDAVARLIEIRKDAWLIGDNN